MVSPDQKLVINPNGSLQNYYASLESRIGYWLVLGGTRHFGYYNAGKYWPFPISASLKAMENHLYNSLGLGHGAEVLDAGCGHGYVAIYMAKRGLRVHGIDVVDRHVAKAQRNVKAAGLDRAISVRKMDFHHLDGFEDESLDGAYTMETFVHATDPETALEAFYRVLKPGGSIAFYEYDHSNLESAPIATQRAWERINKYAAMPSNARFGQGILQKLLADAGFVDIEVKDLTPNVMPMVRLFYLIAYIPYLIVTFLGLQAWFINTVSGVEGYRSRKYVRYVAISAKKPESKPRNVSGARTRSTAP
ncbi:hypothetical protein V490_07910 [Pseudogymnoascus sp. VKM F-3557]|nr:hypothetical protein V490_07910 [Pseudogymnoascus sp. VKM F-3557]